MPTLFSAGTNHKTTMPTADHRRSRPARAFTLDRSRRKSGSHSNILLNHGLSQMFRGPVLRSTSPIPTSGSAVVASCSGSRVLMNSERWKRCECSKHLTGRRVSKIASSSQMFVGRETQIFLDPQYGHLSPAIGSISGLNKALSWMCVDSKICVINCPLRRLK
jgi:hypothetical protein